ncbi:MAG: aminotransferase class III-fold pyridoxal phosphate-dependent enzyme [Patulibacter sp.]
MARLLRLTSVPFEASRGGSVVIDERGDRYLDVGGYSVFLLGHRHPEVVDAVRAQLDLHPLSTRLLGSPPLARASERLADLTPDGLDYVLFASAGTEAVEAALKLARLCGHRRLITFDGGYHGKSLGALSASGRDRYRAPFAPLLSDIVRVRFDDLPGLQRALDASPEPSAVIVEPIQSEAGVRLPSDGYLRGVDNLRRSTGCLVIADEISTGLGRTGDLWASAARGLVPDILLTGKALGGGVMPVSAVVTTAYVFDGLNRDPLLHSSTFAGNPLAAASVVAALDVIEAEDIPARAAALGAALDEVIAPAVARLSTPELPVAWRHAGLLGGIEFPYEHLAADLMMELLSRRVITSHSLNGQQTLRLTPPATITAEEFDWLVGAVIESLEQVVARHHDALPLGA